MSTSSLRIALAAQLNACARSMMVAWGTIVTAFDGQFEVPEPIDFPSYSPVHVVLVTRIGELGREQAFEVALLEREIELQAQIYRRTIKAARDLSYRRACDLVPERFAAAQALADRIDAFVEVLLSSLGDPVPTPGSLGPKGGPPSVEILIRRVGDEMAKQIRSGKGELHGAIASRFGVKPKPGGGDA